MRFSTSAIFVIAAAALSTQAAVIPRNRYANYVERDAVAAAPAVVGIAAREVPPVGYKRMHARDFHTARRDAKTSSDEPVAKREPVPAPAPAAPEVIQVYKRAHPRDFPKRDNATKAREVKRDIPQIKTYKRLHSRDFGSFKKAQA
jgi:hypothetical protein